MRRWRQCVLLLMIGIFLTGCQIVKEDPNKKVKDLEFTVISDELVPAELKKTLEEKKKQEFKVTFQDQNSLYICIGYGEQESGGYSIAVKELYLTSNAIYVDTNLIGPTVEESKRKGATYPYIVLKTEFLDKTVVFE